MLAQPPAPVAVWTFDEGAGNYAHDIIGSNTAKLMSGAQFGPGLIGSALTLDGSAGNRAEVTSPNAALVMSGNKVSLEAVVLLDAIVPNGLYQVIAAKYDPNTSHEYGLFLSPGPNAGRIAWAVGGDGSSALLSPAPLSLHRWHHIIGTYDGASGTRRLYIDGILVATDTGIAGNPAGNGTAPFTIGDYQSGAGGPITGRVDMVAVYNQPVDSDFGSGVSNNVQTAARKALNVRGYVPTNTSVYTFDTWTFTAGADINPFVPGSFLAGIMKAPVAISPDGRRVYVIYGGGTLYLVCIDPTTNKLCFNTQIDNYFQTTIPAMPNRMALSPDGTKLYITHSDPLGGNGSLSVIDTVAFAPMPWSPLQLGAKDPTGVAASADGTRVFVGFADPLAFGNTVIDVTVSPAAVVACCAGNPGPGVAVGPDNSYVYVASKSGQQTPTGTPMVTVESRPLLGGYYSVLTGNPGEIAVDPAGTRFYVTEFASGQWIDVFDEATPGNSATYALIARKSVNVDNLTGLALTPDGRLAYMSGYGGVLFGIRYLDTLTNTVAAPPGSNTLASASVYGQFVGPVAAPPPTGQTPPGQVDVTVALVDQTGNPLAGSINVYSSASCDLQCTSNATMLTLAVPVASAVTFQGTTLSLQSVPAMLNPVPLNTKVRIDARTGSVLGTSAYAGQRVEIVFEYVTFQVTTTYQNPSATQIAGSVTVKDFANTPLPMNPANGQVSPGSPATFTVANGGTVKIQATALGMTSVETTTTVFKDQTRNIDAFTGDTGVVPSQTGTNLVRIQFAIGTITGTVTDAGTGLPIQGATVGTSLGSPRTTTLADGTYSLTVRSVPWKIQAFKDGYVQQYYNGAASEDEAQSVPVTTGATTSGINFALGGGPNAPPGSRPGGIAGAVINSSYCNGNPIVPLWIWFADGRFAMTVMTSVDGIFSTGFTLAPGRYNVQLAAQGCPNLYYPGFVTAPAGGWIDVVAGQYNANAVTFTASGNVAGGIIGTVIDSSTLLGIQGAAVTVFSAQNDGWVADFQTGPGGSFNTGLIFAPGNYKVSAQAQGKAIQYYSAQASAAAANLLSVPTNTFAYGVNFSLHALGLSVTPSSLKFAAAAGTNPVGQALAITNQGVGAGTWSATTDQPWLSVTPADGTAPSSPTVTVDTTGMTPGVFNGNVNVTDASANITTKIPVVLRIGPAQSATAPRTWTSTGSLNAARSGHQTVTLADGRVLVAAGLAAGGAPVMSVEIYDPASGTWAPTGDTVVAHGERGSAARLQDGRVLLLGGASNRNGVAEIYDPTTGTWSLTSTPIAYRLADFTATLLRDGGVLVAGGSDGASTFFNAAELYDPTSGQWTTTAGSMAQARCLHTATLLKNGKVLLAGGACPGNPTSADLFDPASGGTFSAIASPMTSPHNWSSAIRLANGTVLIVGGGGGATTSDLYDPDTNAFTATPNPPAFPDRFGFSAILLPSGKALVAGGVAAGGPALLPSEIYDSATGQWTTVGPPPPATGVYAASGLALLKGGKVLLAGGGSSGYALSAAELYTDDPVRAYVTNFGPGTLSVLDTSTDQPVATIPVDGGPYALAMSADGSQTYVVNQLGSAAPLAVISNTTNTVQATLAGLSPNGTGIALSPDGTRAYVSHSGGALDKISLSPLALVFQFAFGGGANAGLSFTSDPANQLLFVGDSGGGGVQTYDTATDQSAGGVAGFTGSGPVAIVANPVNTHILYTANSLSNDVSFIDATAGQLTKIAVGQNPHGLTVNPDGTRLYVANFGDNTVSVIDTATQTVVATITGFSGPSDVKVTPDGRRAYVVNSHAGSVTSIDLATNTVIGSTALGQPDPLTTRALAIGAVTPSAQSGTLADLSVSITAVPGPILPGSTVVFSITVTNNGPGVASNVTVSDLITSATFFQATPLPGFTSCTNPAVGSPGLVTCTAPTLANGATATLNLVVKATTTGTLVNTATVGATTTDPNGANNTASASVIVRGGFITGTVKDAVTSAAIPGATVRTQDGPTFTQTTTDVSGAYTLTVDVGSYHVEAIAAGYAQQYYNGATINTQGQLVAVANGATTSGINFLLTGGPNGPANQQAGGFSGRATDASTGKGIGNAQIFVNLGTGGFIMPVTTDNTNCANPFPNDPCGSYSTGLTLAPGGYNARVSVNGYPNLWYPGQVSFPTAAMINVTSTALTTNINFNLPPNVAGGISGHVTDASSNPLPGVTITILTPPTPSAVGGSFVISTTTNASGDYSTGNTLQPGNYIARANFAGDAQQFYNGKSFPSTADVLTVPTNGFASPVGGVNFTLGTGAAITGTITRSDTSATVPGAVIDIFDKSTGVFVVGGFTTNGSGVYTTGPILPAGSYAVRVRTANQSLVQTFYFTDPSLTRAPDTFSATGVSGAVGATQSGVDITMDPGAGISGVVKDSGGNPISGATVTTFRFTGQTYSGITTVTTGGTGAFAFSGLRAGDWLVRASASGKVVGYYSGVTNSPAPDSSGATPITLATGQASPVLSIELDSGGGTISGLVTKSDLSGGVPIGTTISVRGRAPRMLLNNFLTSTTTTDVNGAYSVSGLPAGDYIIEAAPTATTAIGWYTGPTVGQYEANNFFAGVPVSVSVTAGVNNVDFSVHAFTAADGPRKITGVIRDATGAPLPFAQVAAFEPATTAPFRFVNTRGDGSYVLNGLLPRTWTIRVTTEVNELRFYSDSTINGELLASAGTPVDVTAGDRSGVDVSLPVTGATIQGRVTSGGKNVAGAFILVRNFNDSSLGQSATTRQDGTFLVRGVTPGQWKIRVTGPAQSWTGTTPSESAPLAPFVTRYYNALDQPTATFDGGDYIAVTAGQSITNINVTVTPGGGTVSGRMVQGALGVQGSTQVRDTSGGVTKSIVQSVINAADGTFAVSGIPTGNYLVRFTPTGQATQWANGKATQETADPVVVTDGATTVVSDAQTSAAAGTISGIALTSGSARLANAAIYVFDAGTGGFVRGSSTTDSQGRYTVNSLAPGTYIAQARALGYSRIFLVDPSALSLEALANGVHGLAAPGGVGATVITVSASADQPNQNVTLYQSADISGTISYTGGQTGPLLIGLFIDASSQSQIYSQVIPAPAFPQGYTFEKPAPDTRGLIPGTYFVRAFLDSNSDVTLNTGEVRGGPIGSLFVAEGQTVPSSFTLLPAPGISGIVTNAGTSVGMSNVTVTAQATFPGGTYRTTTTAFDGGYALNDLLPGSYQVSAQASGFATQWYSNKPTSQSANTVGVTANGGIVPNVNFALSAGAGTITGQITDSANNPLPNVFVNINAAQGGFVLNTPTDASGTYTTGQTLAPGSYKAQVSFPGYAQQWWDGQLSFNAANPITVTTNASATANFTLSSQAGSIDGHVTQSGTGAPLSGIQILVADTANNFVSGARTDPNGNYSTGPVLAIVPYKLLATGPGVAPQWFNGQSSFATATPVTPTATANFVMTAGGTITGTVTRQSDGSVVPGASVDVFDANSAGVGGTTTDGSGRYTTSGLATGDYKIRVRADGLATLFYLNGTTFNAGTLIHVDAGALVTRDIALPAGRDIFGTVTTGGAPLALVEIDAYDAVTGSFIASTQTAGDGTYSFNHQLSPGNYKVRARLSGYATVFANGGNGAQVFNLASAIAVPTITNTDPQVDFTLAAGFSIKGQVKDAGSNAVIAGAIVDAFDQNNNFVDGGFTTDSAGNYATEGRLKGGGINYKVQARAGGYAQQAYNAQRSLSAGNLVLVTTADVPGINFSLSAGSGLTGTVTDLQGQPIAGAIIDLSDTAAGNAFITGGFRTDASGHYDTGPSLSGSYIVRARVNAPQSYVTTFYNAAVDGNGVDFITATPVTPTATANIKMPLGATITGVIREQGTGTPIAGANVFIGRFQSNGFQGLFAATADANGQFTFFGIRDGEWTLRAEAPGHITAWLGAGAAAPASDGGTTIPILVSGSVPYRNLTSGPVALGSADVNLAVGGGRITGTVTKSGDGTTVPANTTIQILTGGGASFPRAAFLTQVSTNAAGVYTASGLASGQYIVQALGNQAANGTAMGWYPGVKATSAASAFPVAVTDGLTTHADFSVMGPALPRTISGMVKDINSNPVRFGIAAAIDPVFNFTVRSIGLNGDGSYTIPNLPPGKYFVRVFTEGSLPQTNYETRTWPNEVAVNAGTLVDVTGGNQSNVDFTLPPGAGVITGRVTTAGGTPVAGIGISLRNFFDSNVNSATTRADGTFIVRALPAGDYKIRTQQSPRPASGGDSAFATAFYTASGPSATVFDNGSFIHVTAGQPTSLRDLVVTPASGRISGRFTDADHLDAGGTHDDPPVAGASITVRDAATGATVGFAPTRADGSYAVEGLLTGSYKLRAFTAGYDLQWYNAQPGGALNQDAATAIPVTSGGADVTNINFAMQGGPSAPPGAQASGFHGQAFDTQGAPLRNVGIVLYDAAAFGQGQTNGSVSGSTMSDSNGLFTFDKLPALPPGQYIAQARALGRARTYFGQKPDIAEAKTFPITVTSPPDPTSFNFTMSRTADIMVTVGYAGSTTGTLNVGLFCDALLSQQVYAISVAAPVFPQIVKFSTPAPDTRGLLPSDPTCGLGGKYYVGAYIDGGGGLTPSAPQGASGGIPLVEGDTTATASVTLVETAGAGGTTTTTQGVVETLVAASGGTASLGNIVITENGPGALSTLGRIRVTLPAGLTFAQPPSVSTATAYSLAIASGASGPTLDSPSTFSFALSARSHGGAATIIVSGMIAAVAPNVTVDGGSNVPVSITVDATASNGLTPAVVQNALLLAPPPLPVPVFSGITAATDFAGLGATRTVVLTGLNLDQLQFTNCNPCDTIDFGPGVTIIGIPVVSPDGTKLTVTIQVAPNAAIGKRTVRITHNGQVLQASVPGGDAFNIDPLPAVTSAGISLDPSGANAFGAVPSDLTKHTIYLVGSNFIAPARPQDFQVQVSGSGVAVDPASVVFRTSTAIAVDVTVATGAESDPLRTVTVTNPDGGVSTPVAVLSLVAPLPDQIQGLPLSSNSGTSTTQATPTISSFSPTQAPGGTASNSSITVFGTNFTAATPVTVTFPAPNGAKVTYTPTSKQVSSGSITGVIVPATAITGNVTVTVGTLVSAGAPFTVTNPRFASLTPSSALQGTGTTGAALTQVVMNITGTSFQSNMSVLLSCGTGCGIVNASGTATSPAGSAAIVTASDSEHVTATFYLSSAAATGFRDLILKNGDTGTTTIPSAFQVLQQSGTKTLTLGVTDNAGTAINTATWLPSVQNVSVTLDSTGKCSTKTVTPTTLIVKASTNVAGPLSFSIVPSAIPGTATNEDCEVDNVSHAAAPPIYDFTIGAMGSAATPILSTTTLTPVQVAVSGGQASVQLWSWDWGGKVRILVQDCTSPCSPSVSASLSLPLDTDGDDLPDVYENNQVAGVDNTNASGVNVFDGRKQDQNANGVIDRDDRFAADGLSNFEKYRGIYLKGPLNGTAGNMAQQIRLGGGKKNLIARGLGFAGDPAIVAANQSAAPGVSYCGVDSTGSPAQNLLPQFPCPPFKVGDAFRSNGVNVIDVAGSFTPTTTLPRQSYANPANPTLDMATVTYDATGCATRSACDHTGKTGIRQWVFPTLGYSSFGSGTTYGDARIFMRAVKGYFIDRPYKHQQNVPGTFLAVTVNADGTTSKPMLAPITIVCDSLASGSDNGVTDAGECVDANGIIGGDVFVPNVFGSDASAMDVNNDGCVELPFVSDPTTLTACTPTTDVASGVQATFLQVVRSDVTHELGHAAGINIHTTDSNDIMYQYTINWVRDNYFSPSAAGLLQIHNKGLQ